MNNSDNDKKTYKTLGKIFISIGILLIFIVFIDFFISFFTFEIPKKFFLFFVSIPFIAIGNKFISKSKSLDSSFSDLMMMYDKDKNKSFIPKITCKICGSANSENAKFCNNCGCKLEVYCEICGTKNNANAKFCNNCGKKIK